MAVDHEAAMYRRDERARSEAQKMVHQLSLDRSKSREKAERELAAAAAAAEKQAAGEEREILSAPVTRYSGGTRKNPGSIIVWHHRCEPPADLGVRERRAGLGPLLALRPGGGAWRTEDAVFSALKTRFPDIARTHPTYVEAVKLALRETVADYPILTVLRDDRRMKEVFAAAGVTQVDKHTETLAGEFGDCRRTVTTINVPTLTDAVVRAMGLELTYAGRLGDSAKNWAAKLDVLKAAFHGLGIDASDMTISQAGTDIRIAFNDRDPFRDIKITSGAYDGSRSLLGITSKGEEAHIVWAGSSGMVVGGVPGSGKTASMVPVLAGLANHAELHIFDGKATYDWEPLRHIARTYDRTAAVDAPLEAMQNLFALIERRGTVLKRNFGTSNFWKVPVAKREALDLYPIVLVLDEAQTWTVAEGHDRAGKDTIAQVTRYLRELILKGRSSGIFTIITTQQPDVTVIPSNIRNNAGRKLCFKVMTVEQAVTILGKLPDNAPNPVNIPMDSPGRFVMEADGQGIVLGQAGYLTDDDAESQLKGMTSVPNQAEVAARLLGDHTTPDGPTPTTDPSLSEDALLAALAEAQRRGLLPPATKPTDDDDEDDGGGCSGVVAEV